jgi:hypothetical protein
MESEQEEILYANNKFLTVVLIFDHTLKSSEQIFKNTLACVLIPEV